MEPERHDLARAARWLGLHELAQRIESPQRGLPAAVAWANELPGKRTQWEAELLRFAALSPDLDMLERQALGRAGVLQASGVPEQEWLDHGLSEAQALRVMAIYPAAQHGIVSALNWSGKGDFEMCLSCEWQLRGEAEAPTGTGRDGRKATERHFEMVKAAGWALTRSPDTGQWRSDAPWQAARALIGEAPARPLSEKLERASHGWSRPSSEWAALMRLQGQLGPPPQESWAAQVALAFHDFPAVELIRIARYAGPREHALLLAHPGISDAQAWQEALWLAEEGHVEPTGRWLKIGPGLRPSRRQALAMGAPELFSEARSSKAGLSSPKSTGGQA